MNRPLTVQLIIPDNFNADSLLTEIKRSDKKQNLKDSMHYILHTLVQMEDRKDLRDDFEERGFYALHSKLLEKICGKRYKDARTLLENAGVIELDKMYSVGDFSTGYRLIGCYASANLTSVELMSRGVKHRFLAVQQKQTKKNNRALSSIPYLTKWLDPERISINQKLAHYFLENYLIVMNDLTDHIYVNGSISHFTKLSYQEIKNKINQRYNSAYNIVNKILNGDFAPTKTGEDQRLHTTISSIKSELRTLITYSGEQLVSLDVTASQPYLFTQLLKPEFYQQTENELSVKQLYPELYEIISKPPHSNKLSTIIMFATSHETQMGTELLSNSFSAFNWSGDFYEYMRATANAHNSDLAFADRTRTKKTMMLLLYNKKSYKHGLSQFQIFETLFPVEAKLIKFFDKLPPKEKSYLPILLQRLESKLMLEIVGKKVSEVLPEAPILTIHDSFLTTKKYAEQVKILMIDTFLQHTGIAPGIKMERYNRSKTIKWVKQTAIDDWADILNSKKNSISQRANTAKIGLKSPLIFEPPKYGDFSIESVRYESPE